MEDCFASLSLAERLDLVQHFSASFTSSFASGQRRIEEIDANPDTLFFHTQAETLVKTAAFDCATSNSATRKAKLDRVVFIGEAL